MGIDQSANQAYSTQPLDQPYRIDAFPGPVEPTLAMQNSRVVPFSILPVTECRNGSSYQSLGGPSGRFVDKTGDRDQKHCILVGLKDANRRTAHFDGPIPDLAESVPGCLSF